MQGEEGRITQCRFSRCCNYVSLLTSCPSSISAIRIIFSNTGYLIPAFLLEPTTLSLQLPPRVVKVRQERLDLKEEDFYQALYTQVRNIVRTSDITILTLNNFSDNMTAKLI